MPHWYVYDEGSEKGPFDHDDAIAYLRTRDPAHVYVWRQGLEEWTPLQDMPELTRSIRPEPPKRQTVPIEPEITVEPRQLDQNISAKKYKFSWAKIGALIGLVVCAADLLFEWRGRTLESWDSAGGLGYNFGYIASWVGFPAFIGFILGAIRDALRGNSERKIAEPPEPPLDNNARFNNFVARHWRGDFPLWVSYWMFGFLGNITVALIPVGAAVIFSTNKGYDPSSIFYASIVMWTGVALVTVWQMVGVWRSATRYTAARTRLGEQTLWGGLAKAVVVLGFLRLLGALGGEGFPQLSEMYRITFHDDPDIPPYSIRLMRDGTEAEIVGGFKYGLTNDFAVVTKVARQLKVVHLDSIGGRLGEGEKLFKLIRERGLNTYVSSKCLSACTLAFAGGRERFLLKGATLGFHKGGFPGVSEGEFDTLQQNVFVAAGFDATFVQRALSTPHKDMWRPSPDILLAAGVIASITDGTVFAASGLGANLTKEKVATGLAKAAPVFRTIQSRFPTQFDSMVDEYLDSILKGATEAETVGIVRGRLLPFIVSLIPQADDDVLIDYNKVLIDQYTSLSAKSPSACYSYASGTGSPANYSAEFSKDLLQREMDVQERVVKTATKRVSTNQNVLNALFAKLRKELLAKGLTDADFVLLESNNVDKSKYAQYCSTTILFFREIGRLPPQENATVLRSIFASK